ncbi:sigma-70 family RNA polymerase sigma factor [uncultured Chitinophaga sp.]|jgi:RNA polymerase sigma factor, sigma-70 family|uniref:RNA polymerase sigma factor n=1 Tax=uncultured Chitinophaga sp. TaxID=339340 RepID=UPI0026077CE2|nr:sigma-70 family RNA polymerase sigma factor [uncultured Chitinophaga sp.]
MARSIDKEFIDQVNQHLGIAHKVCRMHFQQPEEQEDALQEMMFQLWRSYNSYNGAAKFSTWMYRVCLNTALAQLRSKKKVVVPFSPDHLQIPSSPDSKKKQETELLMEAIAALSPVNKSIILLYLEDLSYQEIADITGLTRSNVSVRIVRIKQQLEEILSEKYKSMNYDDFR